MADLPATALFVASQALALALLAAGAYVLGRLLTRRLPLAPGIERAAVAATVGLAALAHVALFLGLVGWLTRSALVAALAAVFVLTLRSWRDLGEDLRIAFLRPGRAAASAIVLVAPLFLLALYPPTAFDATLYHLPMAHAFAASGGLPFLPHLRFPVFPQLQELLFAAMLLLDNDVGAQLVELLAMLLTAALLWGWASRGGRGDESEGGNRLAAAAFLGNPIVVGIGTVAYVEPGLALFAAASFHAAFRYRESGRESGARGWAALAGAAGAAAAATKYLGLWFLAVAGLAILLSPRVAPSMPGPERRGGGSILRRRAGDLFAFAAAAFAVLSPWYGRIVHLTGNPVFPFLSGVFGSSPWRPPAYDTVAMRPAGLAGLLRLPWDTLFARCRAGCEPPLSPVYLLALPLLAVAARRDRAARWALAVALAVVLFYPFAPPDARYLLPALPPLSWALGRAVHAPLAGSPRRLAAATILLLAPGWAYAVYRLVRQGPLPATAAARERYLADRLPMYPAVADLNRRCGARYTVYGFFAENMRYYAAGTFLGDWNGPERYGEVFPLLARPDALADRLARFGAAFALVPRAQGAFQVPASPAWSRRFRPVYSDRAARIFALGGGQPASTVCQR